MLNSSVASVAAASKSVSVFMVCELPFDRWCVIEQVGDQEAKIHGKPGGAVRSFKSKKKALKRVKRLQAKALSAVDRALHTDTVRAEPVNAETERVSVQATDTSRADNSLMTDVAKADVIPSWQSKAKAMLQGTTQLNQNEQRSRKLKKEKRTQAQERLAAEWAKMGRAADEIAHLLPKPVPSEIFADGPNRHRDCIVEAVGKRPYLRHVLVGGYLYTSPDGLHWSWKVEDRHLDYRRALRYADRAKVAEAWGLDPRERLDKLKAKIREKLKPTRLRLLQEGAIRTMLDAALANGKLLVVVRDIAFLYEGEQVGWTIKKYERSSSDSPNETLWHEGSIVSRNYGRVIVLPHARGDGAKTTGHTRNVAGEGPSMPRESPLILPFTVIKDDAMFDAIDGQLYYENYSDTA